MAVISVVWELFMKCFFGVLVLFAFAAISLVGCGGGNGSTNFSTNPPNGAVYVTGEDAPLSSVVGLNLTINSITLSGANSSPQLVSTPITVDFARLVGLRTPLAFGAVPADTYTTATFVLASPVVNFVSSVAPPQVSTLNGTFSNPSSTSPQTTSVTVIFPTPMVVGSNGLAGLHTEFDIRQSLAVDGTGQLTGLITPVMFIQAVTATDPQGQITDLLGTIASVNIAANSFVLQGPFGHQFTVTVNGSTNFNSGFTCPLFPHPEALFRFRVRYNRMAVFWPATWNSSPPIWLLYRVVFSPSTLLQDPCRRSRFGSMKPVAAPLVWSTQFRPLT